MGGVPRYEATALTLVAHLGVSGEEEFWLVEDVDEDGQLGLHEGPQLFLQQTHYVLKQRGVYLIVSFYAFNSTF